MTLANALRTDKKWIRHEKAHVASELGKYMVMGDLGMHPGFSDENKAPPGPMSIFTEAQAAKVWGIGHAVAVVDTVALEHDRQQVIYTHTARR